MPKSDPARTLTEKLTLELRRGTLVLAALVRLRTPKYGYALLQDLANHGVEVEQGTLYPLLRRLDEQGLLESDWNVEGSRPRKYYRLSASGGRELEVERRQWTTVDRTLKQAWRTLQCST